MAGVNGINVYYFFSFFHLFSLFLANANPSPSKMPQFYFFDGDASNPNVQNTIKTNYMNLMKSGYFPPYFCPSDQCTKDNIEVYAGSSKGKTKLE